MTYRPGTFVIDVRRDRLAQVISTTDDTARLREPGPATGPGDAPEWEAHASALRLATRAERAAAGLAPYESGCAKCVALDAARRAAAGGGDRTKAGNATAAAYTHWIVAHTGRWGGN
ncbi:hypothetical protein I5Q34_04240 [Streptomyces sp. AV19]|uniref:hypothetical protein n=1 Tax=Streptomyces sp. AV19 TaxID=2793068 RepID=UPI0018FE13CD|nr:hypothetical protein [Streptomyces sp. AV19]MBH1933505.1 hypothetical protein [Streptomyces sp. AV19]MDG4532154.1 hypothetical protein [Streptomyces sp. AV19]